MSDDNWYVGFVYRWTNNISGKMYIGKRQGTFDDGYVGSGKYFKAAVAKYGIENFSREIIQTCDTFDDLNEAEIFWISYYHAVDDERYYNLSPGGGGGIGGPKGEGSRKPLSEAHKKKLSELVITRPKEWRDKLIGPKGPWSEERKARAKELRVGRTLSEEHKQNISKAGKGRKPPPRTEEHRIKLSEAATKRGTAHLHTPDVIAKRAKANIGKHFKKVMAHDNDNQGFDQCAVGS